jgi:hypothetical protein
MPRSPQEFSPQVSTVPVDSAAALAYSPTVTWATPLRPVGSGVRWLVTVPSPNWPWLFWPQAQTAPAGPATASAVTVLAATWVTPVSPATGAGVAENPPLAPLPRRPAALLPQARTDPSARMA